MGRLRGFTLIELVVSIALMGIILAVVIVNVGSLDVARLKTDASKVSAAVKYLHNLAVMNNAYYRLVIDLSGGRYYGEEVKRSGDACGVFVASEEDEAGLGEGSEGSEGGPSTGLGAGGGGGGPAAAAPPPVPEGAVDESAQAMAEAGKGGGPAIPGGGATGRRKLRKKANLLTRMELAKGIRFTGVASEFRKDLKEEGRGTILFFPDGTIEKALIYLESADEVMTVVTEPAMGVAKVYPDKRDARVLEVEED